MNPPILRSSEVALLLDFDGTLVPYASETRLVPVIDPRLPGLLEILSRRTNRAIAIVSGRGIGEFDSLLGPLNIAISGTHGFEYRAYPSAKIEYDCEDKKCLDISNGLNLLLNVSSFWASSYAGVSLERKKWTLVIHFHNAPEMAEIAVKFAMNACRDVPLFTPQIGRGVVELRPTSANKGRGIARLMDKEPFSGRKPVFIGDDLADEAGFLVVNALGGISVRVGEGESAARYSLPNAHAVIEYLGAIDQ